MYNSRMKTYKFIITGKVQGVYYRLNIKTNASKAGFSDMLKI